MEVLRQGGDLWTVSVVLVEQDWAWEVCSCANLAQSRPLVAKRLILVRVVDEVIIPNRVGDNMRKVRLTIFRDNHKTIFLSFAIFCFSIGNIL